MNRSLPPALQRAKRWFRSLLTNRYFWQGLGVLALVLIVIYALFDWWLMPTYTRHDTSVAVPRVTERSFAEAQQILQRRDLQAERQPAQRFNPNVPRDEVVDQTPPAEALVKPGRRVYLTVNIGQTPTVKIPDLEGASVREAKNRLLALGLKAGEVRPDSVPAPYPNTITRQSPAPGDSLKKGSMVDLWYSRGLGNKLATVPDVTALTVKAARDTLLRHNLRSVVVDAPEDIRPDSMRVQSQGRAPGTKVREGSEIRLFTKPSEAQNEKTSFSSSDERRPG